MAQELGLPERTLSEAQRHAAAVACSPELGAPDLSQREVVLDLPVCPE